MFWIVCGIGLATAVGIVAAGWVGPFENDADWFGSSDDPGFSILDYLGGDGSSE